MLYPPAFPYSFFDAMYTDPLVPSCTVVLPYTVYLDDLAARVTFAWSTRNLDRDSVARAGEYAIAVAEQAVNAGWSVSATRPLAAPKMLYGVDIYPGRQHQIHLLPVLVELVLAFSNSHSVYLHEPFLIRAVIILTGLNPQTICDLGRSGRTSSISGIKDVRDDYHSKLVHKERASECGSLGSSYCHRNTPAAATPAVSQSSIIQPCPRSATAEVNAASDYYYFLTHV